MTGLVILLGGIVFSSAIVYFLDDISYRRDQRARKS